MEMPKMQRAIERKVNPDGSKSVKMKMGFGVNGPGPAFGGRRRRGGSLGATLSGRGPILKETPSMPRPTNRPTGGTKPILKSGPGPNQLGSAITRRLSRPSSK